MERRLQDAYRHCLRLARRSGSSFVYAFRTLPHAMQNDMGALYAFMRHTDDLGDDGFIDAGQRQLALLTWRRSLERALAGEAASDPILLAVSDLQRRIGFAETYLFDVITGVESDLRPHTFQTAHELADYCYHVAGAVGLCCVHIWGFRHEEPREFAIACGHAFQLTNILRDLPEDWANGRLYLPIEDFEQFDLTPDQLTDVTSRPQIRELVRYEVQIAQQQFEVAKHILPELSVPGRRVQSAFFELYGALLVEIRRANFDVFSKRIQLSRWRKLSVSLRCLCGLSGRLPSFDNSDSSQPLSLKKPAEHVQADAPGAGHSIFRG